MAGMVSVILFITSTAISSSLVDFNAYRRPILLLSVGILAVFPHKEQALLCSVRSQMKRGASGGGG